MMLKQMLLIWWVCQLIELGQTEDMICCQSCDSRSGSCKPPCRKDICYHNCKEGEISDLIGSICNHTSTPTSSTSEWDNQVSGEVPALGAVVGLLTVALIVTTTGWIWTCCILKKRGVMDTNSEKIDTNNTPFVHQLHNPTYDANNTQPPPTATDPAHSRAVSIVIAQEGESIPITGSLQFGTQEQQPSIPSLPSNDQRVDVDGESERNLYHVLERPGDDPDYEDLDAELDAEEKAHAEDDQGENLYHVLEGPLEMEGQKT